jgi:hypothetical protein
MRIKKGTTAYKPQNLQVDMDVNIKKRNNPAKRLE